MSTPPQPERLADAKVQVTGSEVTAAIAAMLADGMPKETISIRAIHARLGGRGSLETISRWKRAFDERRAQEAQTKDAHDKEAEKERATGGEGAAHPQTSPETEEGVDVPVSDERSIRVGTVPGIVLAIVQANARAEIERVQQAAERERAALIDNARAELERTLQATERERLLFKESVAKSEAGIRAEVEWRALKRHLVIGTAVVVVAVSAAAAIAGYVGHRLGETSVSSVGAAAPATQSPNQIAVPVPATPGGGAVTAPPSGETPTTHTTPPEITPTVKVAPAPADPPDKRTQAPSDHIEPPTTPIPVPPPTP